mgnify:CR=1 FL=1
MNLKSKLGHFWRSIWEVVKWGYPARGLKVIGVTGTDGKTTTCHLIYDMFKEAGFKVALVSTVAAYIGSEEIDTGFHVTTPDAKFLQPFIKKAANAGMKYLVLETTSHGLDQHRVLGSNFFAGVITNITHEHLDYHQTFEKYRAAKAKLIRNSKFAVLNMNDSSFGYLKARARGQVIPFGKTKIRMSNPALVGEYNRYNVGAAVAVAKILGIRYSVVSKVVKNFAGVPGRMEEIKLGQPFRAMVDFAHTPNALEVLLRQLRKELPKSRNLILVFGSAGLRDKLKRPMMGQIAARLADQVIITAEDPRTESLTEIYKQIAGSGPGFIREDNRQLAINKAVKSAKMGDIVVVTGKGHEKSMCFGKEELPWSDQEAVKKAIKLVRD